MEAEGEHMVVALKEKSKTFKSWWVIVFYLTVNFTLFTVFPTKTSEVVISTLHFLRNSHMGPIG